MNSRLSLSIGLALATAATTACSTLPAEEPLARTDLRAAFASQDTTSIGVTISRSGTRYVFDENAGIFELGHSGALTPVMDMANLPDEGLFIRFPFTDLVALDDNTFAMTAIGDGFVLDRAANTLSLRFCYEPGWDPDQDIREQRTDALAYNPFSDRIIAQPRTINLDTGEVENSLIGYYDRETGVDVQWATLPTDFIAGGMAVDEAGLLVVGSGTKLYDFNVASQKLERKGDLSRFGVSHIDGLAIDTANHTLLIVDAQADELTEIALEQLDR